MKKFLLFISFVCLCGIQAQTQQLAFPGAEGFGRYALGVRGVSNPEIYRVTNLNDAGAGSLRDAVSKSGRIVVFDVSGVIKINSRIVFSGNSYIAGQTAPGDGIIVYGNGVSFSGANNLIVRYMRFFMGRGGDDGKDAGTIASGTDMIFDHCTFLWGRDENFSINWDSKGTEPTNITIQHSIIGQGLVSHSCGGLIQTSGGTSIIGCLYIHNETRNPKVKGLNQFINNVVYNWGGSNGYILADSDGPSWAWMEGNYFVSGPNSSTWPFTRARANFQLYAQNNYVDSNKDGVLNGADAPVSAYGNSNAGAPPTMVSSVAGFASGNCSTCANIPKPFLSMIEPVLSPNEAIARVIASAGASLPARSEIEAFLIDDLQTYGKGNKVISNENQNGITNNVGIVYSGEKSDVNMGGTTKAANGYLEIENFINNISQPVGKSYARGVHLLKMDSRTTHSITLAWKNNQPDADNMVVEISTDGKNFSTFASLNGSATSYQVSGLEEETFYYFRLTTRKGSLSATSSVLRASTEGTPGIPLACAEPEPANGGSSRYYTSVDFSWTNETGEWSQPVTYEVYFGETQDQLVKISGNQSISVTQFEYAPATPLTMLNTYYWRVDARNAYGVTTGQVWSFNTNTYSFTAKKVDLGNDFNPALGANGLIRAQSGATFSNTNSQTVFGNSADAVTFAPSSGIGYNSDNGCYRTSPTVASWRLTANTQYIDIILATEESQKKDISKFYINGTDANPDASARAMPIVVFSDKHVFDPNSILGFEQVLMSICRGGTPNHQTYEPDIVVNAPAGSKSVRLYHTVKIAEVGGDDDNAKYKVASDGDEYKSPGQPRIAYLGVRLDVIKNDNPNASSINTINELWVNNIKAMIDHETGEITCGFTKAQGQLGNFSVNFTLDEPNATINFRNGSTFNFATGPLSVIVTSENGVKKNYTVSVTFVDDNLISNLSTNGVLADIDQVSGMVVVTLPVMGEYAINFALNEPKASMTDFENGAMYDFTNGPLTITVTAANGDVKIYRIFARLGDGVRKKLAILNANGQEQPYDAKLLSAFTDFDVTYLAAAASAPANINTFYQNYDLIVMHSDVSGTNATAVATRNMVGVKPILNLKAYFYNSGRWSWGTPNNAGTGQIAATVPTALQNHNIFEGITFGENALVYYGEPTTAENGIQYLTALDGTNFNAELRAANHVLAYYNNTGIQMHEVNLRNDAKYLLVGLSYEGNSYLKFNDNTVQLLKNAAKYLTDAGSFYDYTTNTSVTSKSADNHINTLKIDGIDAIINDETGLIISTLPFPTDPSGELDVEFVLNDTKAIANVASGVRHDFASGTLQITVMSENGNAKTYTVITDGYTLAALTVNGIQANLKENSETVYELILDKVPNVILGAMPSSLLANIDPDQLGKKTVHPGLNLFTISVTASNGITKNYTLELTVKEFCGTSVVENLITDGNNKLVGKVTLNNDAENLYVVYTVTDGSLSETRTFAGASIPYNGSGKNIAVGNLPNKVSYKNTVGSVSYALPLEGLPSEIIVIVYASVKGGTAYAGIPVSTSNNQGVKYINYTKQACPTYHQPEDTNSVNVEPLVVYPNPAYSFVTVSGLIGNGLITIFNSMGELVMHRNITSVSEQLYVGNLPTGNYVIRVVEANTVRTTILIVE